jgi:hypothetical protein
VKKGIYNDVSRSLAGSNSRNSIISNNSDSDNNTSTTRTTTKKPTATTKKPFIAPTPISAPIPTVESKPPTIHTPLIAEEIIPKPDLKPVPGSRKHLLRSRQSILDNVSINKGKFPIPIVPLLPTRTSTPEIRTPESRISPTRISNINNDDTSEIVQEDLKNFKIEKRRYSVPDSQPPSPSRKTPTVPYSLSEDQSESLFFEDDSKNNDIDIYNNNDNISDISSIRTLKNKKNMKLNDDSSSSGLEGVKRTVQSVGLGYVRIHYIHYTYLYKCMYYSFLLWVILF